MPKKPTVELIGGDGNAFSILGKVIRALKKAGYDQSAIDDYRKEATSGDYDHLLETTMAWVEIE